jgi:hypothetical protein
MALKFGRSTDKTTDPPTEVWVKSEKQTPKKTPERIAKEAKYNANLEVYNKSKADQSAAESEYSSNMGKYNENMKKYNESKVGTPYESMWGASLNKEQLARFNAASEKYGIGGLVASKIRVPKGGDPESFTSNFEKNTDKGSGAKFLPEYVQPAIPIKRKTTSVSEPVEDWDAEILPMKITSVTTKKPKLRQAKEDLTWDPPKFVKEKGVRVPMTKLKTGGKSGVQGAYSKVVGGIEGSAMKYNTEKRRSAAYYGDNTSTGERITGKTESELRQLNKETRGEGVRMLKEGRLGDALTIGKDLSQIRKATRYTKDADLAVDSKTGLTIEGQGSNLGYFTPERTKIVNENGKLSQDKGAMAGYKEFQTQEKGKVFRAQYENATNRNNMSKKLADVATAAATPTNSYSSLATTRGQMKDKYATDNPTATPRQVRQGVRAEIASNRDLMKAVEAKTKKK